MNSEITIHGFETSNNMKVRVALGYKQIPYDFVRIDPADRSGIVKISGQHLTPVMVHGEIVLFDSAAILRYLDANFRDTPRLYGKSHLEEWAIEDEEFVRAAPQPHRAELQGHLSRTVGTVSQLAEKLEGREWLVGDRMSAADIAAACTIERVRKGQLFALPSEISRVEEWVERVMRFDRLR